MNVAPTPAARGLLALLAVTALLIWSLRSLPPYLYHPIQSYSECIDGGEWLMHRLHGSMSGANSNLPLSEVVAAALLNHAPEGSWRIWRALSGFTAFFLTFALGSLLGGLSRALAGVFLLVLSPHLSSTATTWHGQDGYFQTVLSLLVLAVAGAGAWRARSATASRSLVLGAAVGASLLYRSTLVFFPPFVALSEWVLRRREAQSPRWPSLVILFIVPYFFLLPWIGMNWRIHGEFIPLERDEFVPIVVAGASGQIGKIEWDWRSIYEVPFEGSRSGAALAWAAGEVLGHPMRYLRSYALRLRAVFFLHPILFLLAFVGLFLGRRKAEVQFVGILSAYYLLAHCFMAVAPYYFDPFWPLLAVLGAGVLAHPFRRPESRLDGVCEGFSLSVLWSWLSLVWLMCAATLFIVGAYAVSFRRGPKAYAESLDRAIKRNPKDSWLLFQRGTTKIAAGLIDDAVSDMAWSLAFGPPYGRRQAIFIWALLLQGDPAPFLAWNSERAGEQGAEELVLAAHGYLKLGMRQQARERMTLALSGPFQTLSAHGILNPEDFGGSRPIRGRDRVVERMASSCEFILIPTRHWLARRPVQERLLFVNELAKLAPRCGDLRMDQAELAIEAGNRPLARAALDKAVSSFTAGGSRRIFAAYLKLAKVAFESRDIEGANEWVAAVERLAGVQGLLPLVSSYHEKAESAARSGDRRAAREYLALAQSLDESDEVRRLLSSRVDLIAKRAHVAVLAGDKKAATQSLALAEKLGLTDGDLRGIALIYRDIGRCDKALTLLDRLIARNPKSGIYLSDKGVCEQLRGNSTQAIGDLRKAIALEPAWLPSYLTLGAIYAGAGHHDDALAVYEQALKAPGASRDPLRQVVRQNRAEAAAQVGRRGKRPF